MEASPHASASLLGSEMIHTVQHLIEKCLLFYMDREECAACLQRNANLKPAITRIVWDELEKCNVEFFAAYCRRRKEVMRPPQQQQHHIPAQIADYNKENTRPLTKQY